MNYIKNLSRKKISCYIPKCKNEILFVYFIDRENYDNFTSGTEIKYSCNIHSKLESGINLKCQLVN